MKIKKYSRCHAGTLENSNRLITTYNLLWSAKKGITTEDIRKKTGSVAVHSDISSLRANGINIPKAKYCGLSATGRKIYLYKIEP
jgi:hypothetical protein